LGSELELSNDEAIQRKIKADIKKLKEARLKKEKLALREKMSSEMKRAMDFASEKGAS